MLEKNLRNQGKKVFYCSTGARLVPNGVDTLTPKLNMDPALAIAVIDIAGHAILGANGLAFLACLTESKSRIDVLLPEATLDEKSNSYKDVNPLMNSIRICCAEALSCDRLFREWNLANTDNPIALNTLAEAICKADSEHSAEVRAHHIEDIILSNHRSQFNS